MRIEFEQIKIRGQKSMKCADGKKRTRSITITQTLNPFNKNTKGFVKTREEILEELRNQLFKWKNEPIIDY